mmetsp:Transcript_23799/g.32739  ORF Transcript_23799/g.32739 Transcript_23799/m.32739 type:complete len:390 (-) Transcript_23799:272-1441(-)
MTPNSAHLLMVILVSGRGGSRKVSTPSRVHLSPPKTEVEEVRATARDRMPRLASERTMVSTLSRILSRSSDSSSSTCGAPLVTLKVSPSGPSIVASVRLTEGSKGTKSVWVKRSRGARSRELRTRVSSASFGGSFHFAASAAASRTSSLVVPSLKMGRSSCSSIWFMVSVPVLSEHRMFMPAISSTAESRATMAFSSAKSRHPRAIVVVHTTLIAMGMEEMSRTTQKERASSRSAPLMSRIVNVMEMMTQPSVVSVTLMDWKIFSKCAISSTLLISVAVLPKKVSDPVPVTNASHSPLVTVDPMRQASPTRMVTGRDSPVRAAWSTCRGLPFSREQSAGTAPPAPSTTISPGTSAPAEMDMCTPPRFTNASGFRDIFRDAMALPACSSS